MSQTDPDRSAQAWCAALQKKLMAAIDAAWAAVEASDDPAAVAKAREKARLAGQVAAAARKVAALTPPRRDPKAAALPAPISDETEAAAPIRASAAQAAVMQAALARMKRR